MTEQLPRRIEPNNIRVGDTIQREYGHADYRHRETVRVRYINLDDPGYLIESGNESVWIDSASLDWILTDRPEPPREVGSRWLDPATGARYLLDDDGDYIRYRKGSDDSDSVLYADRTFTPQIFARLIPLDGV